MSCLRYLYDVCWKCENFKVKEALCLVYGGLLFFSGFLMILLAAIWLYRSFYLYIFLPEMIYAPLFLLILIGILHPFFAWLGTSGCRREHGFHIVLFIILLIVSGFFDIAIAIWTMMLWRDADLETAQLISKAFTELIGEGDHVRAWDRIQVYLECCGQLGRTDYVASLPQSCCVGAEDDVCLDVHGDGCLVPLRRFAQSLLISIAVTYFFMAFFKSWGITAFIYYYKALRQVRSERKKRLLELEKEEMARELAARELAMKQAQLVVNENIPMKKISTSERQPSIKNKAPPAPTQPPDVLPIPQPKDEASQTNSETDLAENEISAMREASSSGGKTETTVIVEKTPEERKLLEARHSKESSE